MTGYKVVNKHLEICPKCGTKNLISLQAIIFGVEAEEFKEDIPLIEKKCLKCEPKIKEELL